MPIPNWVSNAYTSFFGPPQEESIEEQNQKTKALAGKFDRLPLAGWDDVCNHMATAINSEIAEATKCPMEPEKQRIHVIRWNAMRELFDGANALIDDTKRQRDEIAQMEREMQQYVHRGNDAH